MTIPTRRKRQQIAKDFGFSVAFTQKVVDGLKKYPERYPNGVISSGHIAIVDVEMMLDWIKYRDALSRGVKVPAFRREDYQK